MLSKYPSNLSSVKSSFQLQHYYSANKKWQK